MKKFFLLIAVALLAGLVYIYVFIPASIIIHHIVPLSVNENSVTEMLANEKQWYKWWPAEKGKMEALQKAGYVYDGYAYTVDVKMTGGDSIIIAGKNNMLKSNLFFIKKNFDAVGLHWQAVMPATNNPVQRIKNYLEAVRLKKDIAVITQNFQSFIENKSNAYGIKIEQQQVKDTVLIVSRFSSDNYPSPAELYAHIDKLIAYTQLNNVQPTNAPMLHVVKDSGMYNVMLAMPVNILLAGNEFFTVKKMVSGKILVADVTGGEASVQEAIKKVERYMADYHLVSPALSFESLVTDRSKEPDTAKWITRIYYPVI